MPRVPLTRRPGLPVAALLAGMLLPAAVHAQQAAPAPDKNGYDLFDPTPDSLLRDLSPDRPGKPVTPLTIDAGHLEIESDLLNASYDGWSINHATTRQWVTADPDIRVGLTNWAEFDAIMPLYESQEVRSQSGQGVQRAQGLGDLQLGGKLNFWGNDHGDTALGLIALVKVPTAAAGLGNGHVEYMVGAPFTVALPAQLSLELQPGAAVLREASKPGYAGQAQFVASLSRPIIGTAVSATIEVFVSASADHHTGAQDTLDPSLQWQVGKNVQLDAGVYIGLTKAATDAQGYFGISYRY